MIRTKIKLSARMNGEPTSNWCFIARECGESLKKGKQMTADIKLAGAATNKIKNFRHINWKEVNRFVKRLQMRLAKAVKTGNFNVYVSEKQKFLTIYDTWQ